MSSLISILSKTFFVYFLILDYSITIDSYQEISNIIQLFIEITIINNDNSKDLGSISKFLVNSETIIDMINSVFVKENNMSYSVINNDNLTDFDLDFDLDFDFNIINFVIKVEQTIEIYG